MKGGAESSRIGVSIIPSPSPSDPIKKLFPSLSDSDENRAVKYNHINLLGKPFDFDRSETNCKMVRLNMKLVRKQTVIPAKLSRAILLHHVKISTRSE